MHCNIGHNQYCLNDEGGKTPRNHHGRIKNPWDKLHDEIIETILVQFPTVEIARFQLVCKRWRSIILESPTFKRTSNLINGERSPWFFMVKSFSSTTTLLAYDTEVCCWRHVHHHDLPSLDSLPLASISGNMKPDPVASSAGLFCFRFGLCNTYPLIITNPFTGFMRVLPKMNTDPGLRIIGIAMHASKSESLDISSYKVFVFYGKWSDLHCKVFSSLDDYWTELQLTEITTSLDDYWTELQLTEATINEKESHKYSEERPQECVLGNHSTHFLPAVTTLGNEGQILVYFFFKQTRSFICFDTEKGTYFFLSPRLLKDDRFLWAHTVQNGDRSLLVGLEFEHIYATGGSKIRVVIAEIDIEKVKLKPLPEITSEQYTFTHQEVNHMCCTAHGDYLMICLEAINTVEFKKILMYNFKENKWSFLSKYFVPPKALATPVFSFVPDIRARLRLR